MIQYKLRATLETTLTHVRFQVVSIAIAIFTHITFERLFQVGLLVFSQWIHIFEACTAHITLYRLKINNKNYFIRNQLGNWLENNRPWAIKKLTFSVVWEYRWDFKFDFVEKDFPQVSQVNSCVISCTLLMWDFREFLLTNFLSQVRQGKTIFISGGRWVFSWAINVLESLKHLAHWEQTNFFASGPCFCFMWLIKLVFIL
jgi:hypothetical protein